MDGKHDVTNVTTYTVELATDVDEVLAAYPRIASENMRCAGPGINLYPENTFIHFAVRHECMYVARDETHAIRGIAIIHDDGHARWLTLPDHRDAHEIMAALFDYFYEATGVSVWGDSEQPSMVQFVLQHPRMSATGEDSVIWRKGE